MRRLLIGLCLAALCGVAFAGDTYRFDKGVVLVGDSVAALVKRAGQPDRIVQLENGYGAGMGERWEYYQHDKTVAFVIRDSRVVEIDEVK